jgi:hypothetical protein
VKVAAPLAALALLCACHPQAVNINMTVYPDGSGKVNTLSIHPVAVTNADKDGLMKGAQEYSQKKAAVDFREAVFTDVNKFELGGIRFEFKEQSAGYEMVVKLPCAHDAGWYKILGLTEEEVKSFDDARKNGQLPEVPEDFDLRVMLSVVMPGVVQEQKFDKPLPAGWNHEIDSPSELAFSFEKDKRIKADFIIPLRELLKSPVKELTWTIRSGKPTPFVRRDFDNFQKKHPALQKTDK